MPWHVLLHHLRLKGLLIRGQHDAALLALEFIGYYRLLIYMRPLQSPQKQFSPTVQFDDALQLYDFDRRLRLLFLAACRRRPEPERAF